jgi:hypothetical protein
MERIHEETKNCSERYFEKIEKLKNCHAKNEEDPVKNKKIARRNILAKLGERKNAQVQNTLMTRSCTLCTLKDSQNSL